VSRHSKSKLVPVFASIIKSRVTEFLDGISNSDSDRWIIDRTEFVHAASNLDKRHNTAEFNIALHASFAVVLADTGHQCRIRDANVEVLKRDERQFNVALKTNSRGIRATRRAGLVAKGVNTAALPERERTRITKWVAAADQRVHLLETHRRYLIDGEQRSRAIEEFRPRREKLPRSMPSRPQEPKLPAKSDDDERKK